MRLGEDDAQTSSFWTLDPIDGTKGYLRGAHYCVSLAWVEEGRPTVGVLGCPRLGIDDGAVWGDGALVWATSSGPPQIAPLDDIDAPRPLVRRPPPDDLIRVAESAESLHSDHSLGARLARKAGLTPGEPLRIDSQVKYASVARGDADILLRRPSADYVEKIWDHAAGCLIAQSAGLEVSDLDGRPLDFSSGRLLEKNRGILVAAPELHERLRAALAELESAE